MQLLGWLVVVWGLLSFASLKNKKDLLRSECSSSLLGWAYVVGGSVALAMLLLNMSDRSSEQQYNQAPPPPPHRVQNLGWRGEQ